MPSNRAGRSGSGSRGGDDLIARLGGGGGGYRSPQGTLSYDPAAAEAQRGVRGFSSTAQTGADYGALQVATAQDTARRKIAELQALQAQGVEGLEDKIAELDAIANPSWVSGVLGKAAPVFQLLEKLDRGRQLVTLGLKDVMQFDQAQGTEITGGSYWDVLTGDKEKLIADLGTGIVGEDGMIGFSTVLDDIGWELDEDSGGWEKFARGVVTFAGEVGLDPLTFTGFGAHGLDKAVRTRYLTTAVKDNADLLAKALKEGGGELAERTDDLAIDMMGRGARKQAEQEAILNEVISQGIRNGDEAILVKYNLPPLETLTEGLSSGAAKNADFVDNLVDDMLADVSGQVKDEAITAAIEETADEIFNEAVGALIAKDFAAPALKKIADAPGTSTYLKGGMRVTVPVLSRKVDGFSWVVPGTVGKGRKLSNAIFGHAGTYANQARKQAGKAQSTGLRRIAEGMVPSIFLRNSDTLKELTDSQFLKEIMAGKSTNARQALKIRDAMVNVVGGHVQGAGLNRIALAAVDFQEAAKVSDISNADLERVLSAMGSVNEIRPGATLDEMVEHIQNEVTRKGGSVINLDEGLRGAIEAWTVAQRNSLDYLGKAAVDAKMLDGTLDNYTPHVTTGEANELLDAIVANDWVIKGEGIEYDMLRAMVNARKKAQTIGEQVVGEAAATSQRTVGKTAVLFEKTGDDLMPAVMGDTMIFNRDAIEGGLAATELNEMFNKVLKEMEEYNPTFKVPKPQREGLDFQIYNEDPFQVMQAYGHDMTMAISERQMINMLEDAGMVHDATRMVNQQRMAASMAANLNKYGDNTVARAQRELAKMIEEKQAVIQSIEDGTYVADDVIEITVGSTTIKIPKAAYEADAPLRRRVDKLINRGQSDAAVQARHVAFYNDSFNYHRKAGATEAQAEALALADTTREVREVTAAARAVEREYIETKLRLAQMNAATDSNITDEAAEAAHRRARQEIDAYKLLEGEANKQLDAGLRAARGKAESLPAPVGNKADMVAVGATIRRKQASDLRDVAETLRTAGADDEAAMIDVIVEHMESAADIDMPSLMGDVEEVVNDALRKQRSRTEFYINEEAVARADQYLDQAAAYPPGQLDIGSWGPEQYAEARFAFSGSADGTATHLTMANRPGGAGLSANPVRSVNAADDGHVLVYDLEGLPPGVAGSLRSGNDVDSAAQLNALAGGGAMPEPVAVLPASAVREAVRRRLGEAAGEVPDEVVQAREMALSSWYDDWAERAAPTAPAPSRQVPSVRLVEREGLSAEPVVEGLPPLADDHVRLYRVDIDGGSPATATPGRFYTDDFEIAEEFADGKTVGATSDADVRGATVSYVDVSGDDAARYADAADESGERGRAIFDPNEQEYLVDEGVVGEPILRRGARDESRGIGFEWEGIDPNARRPYLAGNLTEESVVQMPIEDALKLGDPNVPVERLIAEEGRYLDTLQEGTGQFEGRGVGDVGIERPLVLGARDSGVPFVLDGNHRLALAKREGHTHVPVKVGGDRAGEWDAVRDFLEGSDARGIAGPAVRPDWVPSDAPAKPVKVTKKAASTIRDGIDEGGDHMQAAVNEGLVVHPNGRVEGSPTALAKLREWAEFKREIAVDDGTAAQVRQFDAILARVDEGAAGGRTFEDLYLNLRGESRADVEALTPAQRAVWQVNFESFWSSNFHKARSGEMTPEMLQVYEATQASLRARGLGEEFVAYGVGNEYGMARLSLDPASGGEAFIVRRTDVSMDMGAMGVGDDVLVDTARLQMFENTTAEVNESLTGIPSKTSLHAMGPEELSHERMVAIFGDDEVARQAWNDLQRKLSAVADRPSNLASLAGVRGKLTMWDSRRIGILDSAEQVFNSPQTHGNMFADPDVQRWYSQAVEAAQGQEVQYTKVTLVPDGDDGYRIGQSGEAGAIEATIPVMAIRDSAQRATMLRQDLKRAAKDLDMTATELKLSAMRASAKRSMSVDDFNKLKPQVRAAYTEADELFKGQDPRLYNTLMGITDETAQTMDHALDLADELGALSGTRRADPRRYMGGVVEDTDPALLTRNAQAAVDELRALRATSPDWKVAVVSSRTGSTAAHGVSVGTGIGEVRFSAVDGLSDDVLNEMNDLVPEWVQLNHAELSRPGAHIQIWRDGDEVVMEVATVMDSAVRARRAGLDFDSNAVFDLRTGDSVSLPTTSSKARAAKRRAERASAGKKALEDLDRDLAGNHYDTAVGRLTANRNAIVESIGDAAYRDLLDHVRTERHLSRPGVPGKEARRAARQSRKILYNQPNAEAAALEVEKEANKLLLAEANEEVAGMLQTQAQVAEIVSDILGVGLDAGTRTYGDAALYATRGATEHLDAAGFAKQQLKHLKRVAADVGTDMWDDVAEAVDGVIDDFAYELVPQSGEYSFQVFGLGGRATEYKTVSRATAGLIEQTMSRWQIMAHPKGLEIASKQLSGIARAWKSMATVARPNFHLRNFIGAGMNNLMIGVGAQEYLWVRNNMLKFRKYQRLAYTDEQMLAAFGEETWEFISAARKHGITGEGFAAGDLKIELRRSGSVKDTLINPASGDFALNRAGGFAMESIEDFHRMAAFRKYYAELGGEGARDYVNMVHFNYSDLSQMEQKLKKLVPFYVWTRNNIPLQMQMLLEHPGNATRYVHMMNAVDDNTPTDRERWPMSQFDTPFAADLGMQLGGDSNWARLIFDPDLPITDLASFEGSPMSLETWASFAGNVLGPHITTPLNISEQNEWGNTNAPFGFNAAMRVASLLPGYDPVVSAQGDVQIGYGYARTLSTALPIAGEYSQLFGASNSPNQQQKLGLGNDPSISDRLKGAGAFLGRGLGIGAYTPNDARSEGFKQQQEIRDIIDELKITGVLSPADMTSAAAIEAAKAAGLIP